MQNTILLVEDEKGLLDSLSTELGFENYNVICAADGLSALDQFQKNKEKINMLSLEKMKCCSHNMPFYSLNDS